MERKLATVLFIDIVDSTGLVTRTDPEVVRRRVGRFFERVAHCVQTHGGIVEKFAGDAVLAAFGIPQAHEDDAERAARAALAMLDAVHELDLEARIGIESGELVVDAGESSFATGEAVNVAARLQQAAHPGEILIGPTAHHLSLGRLATEEAGPLLLKGLAEPLRAWRVGAALERSRRSLSVRAPLIGRESELELLSNTLQRTLRDRRAHLFTIYGEPGVGKSRLGREFLESVEGVSVLSGRCLPYGEGITYWALAEMIKAAAGISDDDPLEEAFAKLRACCEDEAVADLLGLASGVLEALEGQRSADEIAWAARELIERLGEVQPLILLFEDIHWAEEPLLELIELLADRLRAPVLILCIARPELLDVRPGWGGGRVRSTAIELEPLSAQESAQLVQALTTGLDGLEILPPAILARTEGNPLFVEETIRMLRDDPGPGLERGIPGTVQALIAARIDRLAPPEKALLQRASVIGRVFWHGAVEHLAPELEHIDLVLDDLLMRDFLLREVRSSISGETAFRFKHVLIREVAYSGLSKDARAKYHASFADWLAERAGEELVEIRAYHLERTATLLAELDGVVPRELAHEAAAALETAGRRAHARESYTAARKLLSRAQELEPTVSRRFLAARALRQLGNLPAVGVEMEQVRAEASAAQERQLEARALVALAEVALNAENDVDRAEELVAQAMALLDADGDTDPEARFEALGASTNTAAYRGDLAAVIGNLEQAFAVAIAAGRTDLQTSAALGLAQTHLIRLEFDRAEPLLRRAFQLAEDGGSLRGRAAAQLQLGRLLHLRGQFEDARAAFDDVRATMTEIGYLPSLVHVLGYEALLLLEIGELEEAEKLLRECLRVLAAQGEQSQLGETQSELVLVLVELGRLDEAERLALEATARVGSGDVVTRAAAELALGAVRAAQGRDEEGERLLRAALATAEETQLPLLLLEPLKRLVGFLHGQGRSEEAVALEERLAHPVRVNTARIA